MNENANPANPKPHYTTGGTLRYEVCLSLYKIQLVSCRAYWNPFHLGLRMARAMLLEEHQHRNNNTRVQMQVQSGAYWTDEPEL